MKPLSWRANPDEETTDWRAVRGRTAHTVRRALALPDPYPRLSAYALLPPGADRFQTAQSPPSPSDETVPPSCEPALDLLYVK